MNQRIGVPSIYLLLICSKSSTHSQIQSLKLHDEVDIVKQVKPKKVRKLWALNAQITTIIWGNILLNTH